MGKMLAEMEKSSGGRPTNKTGNVALPVSGQANGQTSGPRVPKL